MKNAKNLIQSLRVGFNLLLIKGCVIELMVNVGGDWHVEKEVVLSGVCIKEIKHIDREEGVVDLGVWVDKEGVYVARIRGLNGNNNEFIQLIDKGWKTYDNMVESYYKDNRKEMEELMMKV